MGRGTGRLQVNTGWIEEGPQAGDKQQPRDQFSVGSVLRALQQQKGRTRTIQDLEPHRETGTLLSPCQGQQGQRNPRGTPQGAEGQGEHRDNSLGTQGSPSSMAVTPTLGSGCTPALVSPGQMSLQLQPDKEHSSIPVFFDKQFPIAAASTWVCSFFPPGCSPSSSLQHSQG